MNTNQGENQSQDQIEEKNTAEIKVDELTAATEVSGDYQEVDENLQSFADAVIGCACVLKDSLQTRDQIAKELLQCDGEGPIEKLLAYAEKIGYNVFPLGSDLEMEEEKFLSEKSKEKPEVMARLRLGFGYHDAGLLTFSLDFRFENGVSEPYTLILKTGNVDKAKTITYEFTRG
jgi:hypothetical protein